MATSSCTSPTSFIASPEQYNGADSFMDDTESPPLEFTDEEVTEFIAKLLDCKPEAGAHQPSPIVGSPPVLEDTMKNDVELYQWRMSYPTRCWSLIYEVREYERDPLRSQNPALIELILSQSEMLLRDYKAHRAPYLSRVAKRIGTVPYTLRLTLYMLLILCSKLREPGMTNRLEIVIDAFIGDYDTGYGQLLASILAKAASYRTFEAVEEVRISHFYTEVFCSLMRGTPERLHPGGIDTLRAYFANVPVEPRFPDDQLGRVEEDEYINLGSKYWDRIMLAGPTGKLASGANTAVIWPRIYDDRVQAMARPLPTKMPVKKATKHFNGITLIPLGTT